MSKKVRVLLKKLILFLGLLALGYLSDGLPDAIWSFVIQSGLYGSALFVGIKLLMDGEEQRKEIETIKKTDLNEPRLIKRQIIQLKILLNFMRNLRKFIHFKMEEDNPWISRIIVDGFNVVSKNISYSNLKTHSYNS